MAQNFINIFFSNKKPVNNDGLLKKGSPYEKDWFILMFKLIMWSIKKVLEISPPSNWYV